MKGRLLCIMKKTKEMINEERKLLRLCSQSYKDMIHKKKVMTVNDFNRFLCVITTLGLEAYEVYFSNQMFPELLKQLSDESERRKRKIDLYFRSEDNLYAYVDSYNQYLLEFLEQMPLESQKRNIKRYLKYNNISQVDYFDGRISLMVSDIINL